MIGAGVFFVWAPAASAAGSGLFIALGLAAVVASLNALSTTQLAMSYPVSGGAYSFARATIGERTGFTAGLLFLSGKTASVGAIALIAGNYAWPDHARLVAVAVLAVFAILNMSGIRSTATVSLVIVVIVLLGLAVTLGIAVPSLEPLEWQPRGGVLGVLNAAALLFFSFAGYARMATLGEEVVDPRRTLPRAIITSLVITVVVYGLVAMTVVAGLGVAGLASSTSPLADLGAAPVLVRVIAAVACLGSLVGILAGLSRTALAMARTGDLPWLLGFVWPRTHAPVVAEAAIALLAIAAVLLLEPGRLVGFSSTAVLSYYAIAHAAALRQPRSQRWLPRWVQVVGLVGCAVLTVTLPWQGLALCALVVAIGLGVRTVKKWMLERPRPQP